ncbi:MAG: helix-turn-helix domain-containing protein [Tannerellaceae bacterium]|jgi:AraC-like DNA-binding protein|nr:helix-turn-helix domain-containing protein [Tannerellaceae bacterium]
MDKLPFIEVSEIIDYISVSATYRNVVTVADMDAGLLSGHSSGCYSVPVRINQLFILVVFQGSLQISLDYVPYTVSANCLVTIMPEHIIQIAESTEDLKARLLIIDRTFLDDCRLDKRTPSMTGYMQLRKNPCNVFAPEETSHIRQCLLQLEAKIKQRTHAFHREVIQNSVVAFLLELANILAGKKDALARPTFSRREEIMNRFLQLLFEHVGEQHLVTFYAEKLCITPQYLSLVLKEVTGKPANKWIDEALVVEAKVLLKAPQTTIQQVADALNFSDQSTFGKFFKKNTGISPTEYRKS